MSADTAVEPMTRQLVVFTLGSDHYAVPLAIVQEIIRHAPPRPIPGSPMHVQGVINLRGRIIPVIDLRSRFGVVADPPLDAKVVIIQIGELTVGVAVDEVHAVLTVGADRCEPPAEGPGDTDHIEAVAELEGRLLVILDMSRLLGDLA